MRVSAFVGGAVAAAAVLAVAACGTDHQAAQPVSSAQAAPTSSSAPVSATSATTTTVVTTSLPSPGLPVSVPPQIPQSEVSAMPTSPSPAKANRFLAALNQAGVHIDSATALSVGESICELRASNVPTPSAISYTTGVLTPTLGAAAAAAAAPRMVAAADSAYCSG